MWWARVSGPPSTASSILATNMQTGVVAPPPAHAVWYLAAQVPELVGDEVQVPKGDLVAQLHLFHVISDLEDEAHLKHDDPICKRPLTGMPTVGSIYSGNTDQRIRVQEIR